MTTDQPSATTPVSQQPQPKSPVVDRRSPCSTCVLLNAQGITPQATSSQRWKLPFLVDTLEESCSDFIPFICITETWLKSYISDSQIAIDGYTALRSDREKIQRGGVLMYVNNSFPVSDVVTYDEGNCEAVMCTLSSIDTILINIYLFTDLQRLLTRSLLNFSRKYSNTSTKSNSWKENTMISILILQATSIYVLV